MYTVQNPEWEKILILITLIFGILFSLIGLSEINLGSTVGGWAISMVGGGLLMTGIVQGIYYLQWRERQKEGSSQRSRSHARFK